VQVSSAGGVESAWSPTGDRIFYREGNAMMAADVQYAAELRLGKPQRLFDRGWELPAGVGFGVMPDSKRFVMARFESDAMPARLDVVFNWFEDLKQKVPVR
jgi:hypothetical protein